MAALLTKHSVVSTFKKTGVSFRSFVKRKRSLSFEISRYLFASHEDQFAIIVNQYALSYLIINLLTL